MVGKQEEARNKGERIEIIKLMTKRIKEKVK